MRVAVIGAGIVGVTTAFELALAGHEVQVLERRSGLATEASFACGGWLAADTLAGWPPEVPDDCPRSPLGHRLQALTAAVRQPAAAGWLWRRAVARTAGSADATRRASRALAKRSMGRLDELIQAFGWEPEHSRGSLLLLPDKRTLAQAQAALARLANAEVPHQLLNAEQARLVEPGLSDTAELRSAIHLPGDASANVRQMAHLLKSEAQRRGAQFRFDTEVMELTPGAPWQLRCRSLAPAGGSPGSTRPVRDTDPEGLAPWDGRTDAVVLCSGLADPPVWRPLGLALPLWAVHGHSITAPMPTGDGAADAGPRSVVVDLRQGVQISRLGERVRVCGGAFDVPPSEAGDRVAWARLYQVLEQWFPGAARTAQAQQWRGARPALPDGLPATGAGPLPGLWLNLGHGHQGWAWAFATAGLIAEQLSGPAGAGAGDTLVAAVAPNRLR